MLYATSMMIVRDTYEACKKVKNMLQTHMVEYEERDIFMSKDNQRELQERLGQINVDVPQVFVNGQHIGVSRTVCRRVGISTVVVMFGIIYGTCRLYLFAKHAITIPYICVLVGYG